jgi:hypothetical protein
VNIQNNLMNIGKLEKVDLRKLWNGEASEFTPWLAQEENIALLGETIGIELEVQEQEKSVGPFRADILCKDTINEKYVVIENQLEKTDHSHLGQIMTYAAGLDAVTIIWIAKTFSEEHRATLDWLNKITDEGINFFGIEIEVYKIGDSLPAPLFNIIAKPNDWFKSIRSSSTQGKITETKQLQLEYWIAMKKYFETTGTFLKSQKPAPQHWTSYSIGSSNFHLSAIVGMKDKFIRIDFYMVGQNAKENFQKLKNDYEDESMKIISEKIIWNELPEGASCIVSLRNDCSNMNRTVWEEQFKWFKENLEKFDRFFRPKLKGL